MNMPFCKLQAPLLVEFLEKGSSSSNPIIVFQGFKASFKGVRRDLKLEILNDENSRQSTRFMVFGDVKDYLVFMVV